MRKVRQHDELSSEVGGSLCHTFHIHYAVVAAAEHQHWAGQTLWLWQRQVGVERPHIHHRDLGCLGLEQLLVPEQLCKCQVAGSLGLYQLLVPEQLLNCQVAESWGLEQLLVPKQLFDCPLAGR